jgi:hypothetical protein
MLENRQKQDMSHKIQGIGTLKHRCFEVARDVKAPYSLQLVGVGGITDSLEYSGLNAKRMIPGKGIILQFTQAIVTIYGQHLSALFDHLSRHRVTYISILTQELSAQPDQDNEAIITHIEVHYQDEVMQQHVALLQQSGGKEE